MSIEITERQQEIIEAAAKLLTQAGVSGLTIKNLAKEMDFSESAIYRHFNSKEEIILMMFDFMLTEVKKETLGAIAASTSAAESISILFHSQFSFFDKNRYLTIAIFSDGLLEQSQRINEKILSLINSRKTILEPLVRRAQESGDLTKEINAEEIVHIIMGSVRLLVFQWRASQFGFDITQKGSTLVDNIIKLMRWKSAAIP